MGLDMYFYKANRKFESDKEMYKALKTIEHVTINDYVDVDKKNITDNTIVFKEFKYFRKHSDLHGFIDENRSAWHRETFPVLNCANVLITKEFLLNIKRHATKCLDDFVNTEHTTGFFFGQTMEGDWVETIKMIDNILANVDFDKESIIYDCWW